MSHTRKLAVLVALLSFCAVAAAQTSVIFDPTTYEGIHPDIKNVYGVNLNGATYHWNNFGLPAGWRGSVIFDPVYYLQHNPDLVQAFGPTGYVQAAQHFLNQGLPVEGRRGSLEFDVKYYLAKYPDLAAAYGTNYAQAAQHFLIQGLPNEGRQGSADVNVQAYILNYPDIAASYNLFFDRYTQAMLHWLRRGQAFGRTAVGNPVTTSPDCTSSAPPLIAGTSIPYSRIYIGLTGHDGSGTTASDPRDGSGTNFDAILRGYSGDPSGGVPATDHLIVCLLPGTYQTDGAYNFVIDIPHKTEKVQNRGFALGPYWHIHGNGDGSGASTGTPTVVQLASYYVPPAGGEPASLYVPTGSNTVFSTGSDTNPGVEISDLTIDDNYPTLKQQAGTMPLQLSAIKLRDNIGGHYVHRVRVTNAASDSGMGEGFPVWINSVAYSNETHASPSTPPSQDNLIEFVTMDTFYGVACTAITMSYATGDVRFNVVNGYQIAYGGWEMPLVPGSGNVPNKFVYIHDNFSLNTVYGMNIDSEFNNSVNVQYNEIVNPKLYGIVVGGPTNFANFTFLYNEIYLNTGGTIGIVFQGTVQGAIVARTNILSSTNAGGKAFDIRTTSNYFNVYQYNQINHFLSIPSGITTNNCAFGNWSEGGTQRSDFPNTTSTPCRPGL